MVNFSKLQSINFDEVKTCISSRNAVCRYPYTAIGSAKTSQFSDPWEFNPEKIHQTVLQLCGSGIVRVLIHNLILNCKLWDEKGFFES